MPDAADLVPDFQLDELKGLPPVPAAVLIALIERDGDFTILYTKRAGTLRRHSGQVAFPGGRIDPGDAGAADAALREANEEVNLHPGDAQVLGFMPNYYTGTNYYITPVVALVSPRGPFTPNPGEVDAVFEGPVRHLVEHANYGTFRITHRGQERSSWQIDHQGHRIWGITANLTRQFRDSVLTDEAQNGSR